jgi:hypothetical protein
MTFPMKRLAVLMVAILLPAEAASVRAAAGRAVAPVTVSRTVDHLRLTMSVSKRNEPRNALIHVRMTVTNLSHHTVRIGRYGCVQNPSVSVLDAAGHVLYPPALSTGGHGPSCGPGNILPVVLPVGHQFAVSRLAILRGPTLHMSVLVVKGSGIRRLRGPTLTLALYQAAAPTATLQTTGHVSLSVTPPPGAHGKMRYQEAWGCKTTDETAEERFMSLRVWVARAQSRLERTWPGDCGTQRW